jgi:hypothetical protein
LLKRAGYDLDASRLLDSTRERGEQLRAGRLLKRAGYDLDASRLLDSTRERGEQLRAGRLLARAGYDLDASGFLDSTRGTRQGAPLERSHGPGHPLSLPRPA